MNSYRLHEWTSIHQPMRALYSGTLGSTKWIVDYRFFFSSRRRHTRCGRDWSSDVCSSDLTGRVTGVNTSLLDVLHDAADNHVGAVTNGIDIHLDGGIQEVVQQYRAVVGYQNGTAHVTHQLGFVIDDFHGTATQHVGRTNHQRIADFTGRQDTFFMAAHSGVLGLLQAQALDHLLETLTVFGTVNSIRAGADNGHTSSFQATGQFQRGLATVLHNDALRFFDVDDFQHVFQGDRLEVQPVGGIVVGRHGLRVAVDHDGFVTVFTHGQGRVHTAVVEFDALADTVGAATDHHDLLAVRRLRLALFLVSGVHVGGVGGKLSCTGIYPLVHRANAQVVAQLAQADFGNAQQLGQAGVGEALALQAEQGGLVDIGLAGGFQGLLFFDQVFNLHQVPGVHLGMTEHFVDGHAGAEGITDVPGTLGAGYVQLPDQDFTGAFGLQLVQLLVKTLRAHFQTTQGFLHGFLEGTTNRHHLTHRLHLGSQAGVGLGELLEGEARNLGNHVVDAGLERGRGYAAGNFVLQLIKGVSDGQLGRDLGNRETGGLGSQRGGTGYPRVHLDHDHTAGVRIDAELYVGAAGFHTDLTQHRQGGVPHDLVFLVGQGLGRGNSDGVTGVHAHGVEVLDGADDDAVVVLVANDFHLILFPADQGLVDQQLVGRRQVQTPGADFFELILVVGDTAAGAAHGEGGTNDAREADVFGRGPGFGHGVNDGGARALKADFPHGLVKTVTVFGFVDGVGVGADHFHTVLFQNPVFFEIQSAVQRSLTTHGGQQGVRLFFLDDLFDRLPGDGLDVGGIGHGRVGHDGGRVGVHQDNPVTLFAQRLAGLGPGVVEFARLPDHDKTCAQDQDALDVCTFWHVLVNLSATFEFFQRDTQRR